MTYQYKESGLDNIYLVDGYTVHKTPYGEGVSITDSDGLHKAIGKGLISQSKPLDGAGLRFLRLEMETTQKRLAELIGATEQTLRLWEKHRDKAIPGPADRLVRAIYAEITGGDGSLRARLESLAELDQQEYADACFQHDLNHKWMAA